MDSKLGEAPVERGARKRPRELSNQRQHGLNRNAYRWILVLQGSTCSGKPVVGGALPRTW